MWTRWKRLPKSYPGLTYMQNGLQSVEIKMYVVRQLSRHGENSVRIEKKPRQRHPRGSATSACAGNNRKFCLGLRSGRNKTPSPRFQLLWQTHFLVGHRWKTRSAYLHGILRRPREWNRWMLWGTLELFFLFRQGKDVGLRFRMFSREISQAQQQ